LEVVEKWQTTTTTATKALLLSEFISVGFSGAITGRLSSLLDKKLTFNNNNCSKTKNLNKVRSDHYPSKHDD